MAYCYANLCKSVISLSRQKVFKVRLALYQPDIPQNTGTLLRLAACLDIGVDLIEPCGFVLDDKRMRRAGMDYLNQVDLTRHQNWSEFQKLCREEGRRIILATTKSREPYFDFQFHPNDVILMGQESAGVPDEVHQACDHRLTIPMQESLRSINMAVSAAMMIGEGLRQTAGFPPATS